MVSRIISLVLIDNDFLFHKYTQYVSKNDIYITGKLPCDIGTHTLYKIKLAYP